MMVAAESASSQPALPTGSGGIALSAADSPVRKMRALREFLAANRGKRGHSGAFVLIVHPRGDDDPAIGIGITVTKKIGNAVVRNRIKRRFRALARDVLPEHGHAGADHVLIGKQPALTRDFAALRADLVAALANARPRR